jgi:hypothetical protein
MEMRPPTFYGYTTEESILTFIEDFEQFAAVRALGVDAQLALLPVSLRGPARDKFNAATITDTDAVKLANMKVFLRTTYYTEEIKQALKDQLNTICQGLSEDPNSFYT